MCGICGVVDLGAHVEPGMAREMNAMMVHRGPDAEGMLDLPHVSLAMRRLSIIDLDGGGQPIWNEAHDVAVFQNGEIYNHEELRIGLAARGHHFATRSDTEVIVHLYEEEGLHAFAKLDGMFAIAVWDARAGRLTLARDKFGEKPLYYTLNHGRLTFASDLKALIAAPGVDATLDPACLMDVLRFLYVPEPRTPFHQIHALPAAHVGVLDAHGWRISQYWDLATAAQARRLPRALPEAAEMVRQGLEDAIATRMRSDVPVGAFLSGGVDSSAVVALAQQRTDHAMQTFAVGFEGATWDERPYAREVAENFGTHHREIGVTLSDVERELPAIVNALDTPNGDSAIVPTYRVARLASRHVKVILSGLGGDEVFGGYPRYFDGVRAEHAYRKLPGFVRHGVASATPRALAKLKARLAWNAVPSGERYLEQVTHLPQNPRTPANSSARSDKAFLQAHKSWPRAGEATRRMAVDVATYLPGDLLHLNDRMTMIHSLEGRAPFLAAEMVALGFALPDAAKVDPRTRQRKVVLGRALHDVLPARILNRKKQGFGAPVTAWLNNGIGAQFQRLLPRGRLAALAPPDVRRVLAKYGTNWRPTDDWRPSQTLWTLGILEMWLRQLDSPEQSAASLSSLGETP